MTQVGKAITLVSAIGAVGGGIAVASGAFNQSEKQQPQQKTEDVITISSKLASEGFDTNVDVSEWNTLLIAHDKVQDGNTFRAESSEIKNGTWLKNKCQRALNKGEKDNNSYLLARQWCVKETSINDLFAKEGSKYRVLNTREGDTEIDKDKWVEKISTLKINAPKKKALGVELNGEDLANIVEIKKVCATIVATKTTAKEFNEKFELAKDWCAA